MRLGIVTLGGDCSGLNSVIYGAYKTAKNKDIALIGFNDGIKGLIDNNYIIMDDKVCDETLLSRSGTILRTNNVYIHKLLNEGMSPSDIYEKILSNYESNSLDGLIYIGGDGSMRIAREMLSHNKDKMKIVAIPKTIDNDIFMTDFSIGFKTALDSIVENLERIRSTIASHERIAVVEVMGRDAGFLAMYSGIASGSDIILVNEFTHNFEAILKKIKSCYDGVKNHCIIIVAEAVELDGLKHNINATKLSKEYTHHTYNGAGKVLADKLASHGYDAKHISLGHTQRGGITSINDRIMGAAYGSKAVEMLMEGKTNKMLYMKSGNLDAIDIFHDDVTKKKLLRPDDEIVSFAKNMGIYCGEI